MASNTFFLFAFSGEMAVLYCLEVAVWNSRNTAKAHIGGGPRCKGNWSCDCCWVKSSNQLRSLVLVFTVSLMSLEMACLVPVNIRYRCVYNAQFPCMT